MDMENMDTSLSLGSAAAKMEPMEQESEPTSTEALDTTDNNANDPDSTQTGPRALASIEARDISDTPSLKPPSDLEGSKCNADGDGCNKMDGASAASSIIDFDNGALSPDSEGRYEGFYSAGFGLSNLMEQLDGYTPTIPEPVTDYLLHMSGFEPNDPRLSKLISVAAQKFISDILNDAFTYCKLRTAAPIGGKTKSKDKKYVLTMEDLVPVLHDYGVTVKKPPYFV